MQELCWACETMTRQMQWEVLHSEAAPTPPLPNKESRLSPATFSSRSAQLRAPAWEGCLHTHCLHPGRMGRTLAQQATGAQLWDMGEGKLGMFQHAQGPGRRAALSRVKTSHKPTDVPLNITRTITWVPCHYTDESQHWAMVGQLWQVNTLQRS